MVNLSLAGVSMQREPALRQQVVAASFVKLPATEAERNQFFSPIWYCLSLVYPIEILTVYTYIAPRKGDLYDVYQDTGWADRL